jgi:ribosomal-protein-alanine N-acetyltransferase
MNDYEVVKFTEQRFRKHTDEDIRRFVEEILGSETDILFGIFFDDKHIGNIKLGPINWEHANAGVSYFIGEKNYWSRGIATSIVKTVVDFGFKKLNLEKINAGYYSTNLGSAVVLERCGFLIEGTRKNNFVSQGERIDGILVGLSYDDLPAQGEST